MIYQYKCQEKPCGLNFFKDQGMREKPLTICPNCGGRVERVITGGAGFILKGSGFYRTDNREDLK